jgi:hypothetical protein
MNRFILSVIVFVFTFLSTVQAELFCGDESSSGFSNCHPVNSVSAATNPCPNGNAETENNKAMEHAGIQEHTPVTCNDDDLFKGLSKSERPTKKELVKDYTKQCKKKAKKYKRAVFKKMLKQFKLGQAFQALFKKKKNIYKVRSTSNGGRKRVSANLSPEEMEGMSQQELNDYIMDKLNEKVPGLTEAAKKQAEGNIQLSKGFHESETIPMNIVVQKNGRQSCTVNVDDAPEKEPFTPKPCEFCKGKDVKNSFVDDCAYMTSNNFSEEDALKVVGSNKRKRNDYCQPAMENKKTDMGQINSMANQLCDIAKKGLVPDFDIETTRNLYNDKTENLAGKRGEFIQKYLKDKVKKDCDLEETPDWLDDDQEFASRIRVKHPEYEGRDKKGDYGPDPYAPEEKQAQEIENLGKTMVAEKQKLMEKRDLKQKEMQNMREQKEVVAHDIAQLKKKYDDLKKELQGTTEVAKMNAIYQDLSVINNGIHDLHNSMDSLEQKINDNLQEVQGLGERIGQYSDIRIQRKKEMLQAFYQDKKSNPNHSKAEWDRKLFNQFKMVRISGKAVEDHGLPSIEDGLSPELSVALNALVRLDQFTCSMEPISTHKNKFKGALKVLGKVGLAIASPVVLGVGLGAAVVASPITTTASLFCQGCGKPGQTMPRWMMFGNPRALDLKRGWPKRLKSDINDGIDAYFNLGGLLKIHKSDRITTVHQLEDFNEN